MKKVVSYLMAVIMVMSMLPSVVWGEEIAPESELAATGKATQVSEAATDEDTEEAAQPTEPLEPIRGADGGDPTGEELADAWGFSTKKADESVEREASGENPFGAYGDNASAVSVVPRELAVLGGTFRNLSKTVAKDNHYKEDVETNKNIMYYKDHTTSDYDCLSLTKEKEQTYSMLNSAGEINPSAAIAGDFDGDGIDEIAVVYIDMGDVKISDFNSGKKSKPAGGFPIKVEIYDKDNSAYIGQTIIGYFSGIGNTQIPENVLEWSSLLQITKGDYKREGKDSVAVGTPAGVDIVSLDGSALISDSIDITNEAFQSNANVQSVYSLDTGDINRDGVDDIVVTYVTNIFKRASYSSIFYNVTYDRDTQQFVKSAHEKITLPNDDGTSQEAYATSVTVGDVDGDGYNEVIFGGYVAQNATAEYTHTYNDGSTSTFKVANELFMAYKRSDENGKLGDCEGFTVLREDEKTAWVNDGGTYAKDVSTGRYYGHSWNWTVPLKAVSLGGRIGNISTDQIFFGNGMYHLSGGKFRVYDDKAGTKKSDTDDYAASYTSFDNNNSSVIAMIPGYFLPEMDDLTTAGREQLLVYYAKDNKWTDGGDVCFGVTIFYEPADGTAKDVQTFSKYLGMSKWESRKNYPLVTAPNIDDDAYLVKYIGHEYVLTDPEAIAIMSSPPTFTGLNAATTSTSYGVSSTDSSGSTFNVNLSAGWYGAVSFGVDIDASITVGYGFNWVNTNSVSNIVSYDVNNAMDGVVVASVPYDVYGYMMFTPEQYRDDDYELVKYDGYPDHWAPYIVNVPCTPVTQVMSVEKYNELAERTVIDGEQMEKITYGSGSDDLFTYTIGDPGTYPSNTNGLHKVKGEITTASNPISVTYAKGGSESTTLSLDESHNWGFNFSLRIGGRIGAGGFGSATGAEGSINGSAGGTFTNSEGTSHRGSIANYSEEGYNLTTKLHTYDTEINGEKIPVIAYTVDSYNGKPVLPQNVEAVTDKATETSVTFAYEMPKSSSKLTPNSLRLYCWDNYQGGSWKLIDNNLPVASGKYEYTVEGLSANNTYKFMLASVRGEGTSAGDKNTMEISAKTLVVAEAPTITTQPKAAYTSKDKSAEFTVEAKVPSGVSAEGGLRYNWYYAEATETGEAPSLSEWKKLSNGTSTDAKLKGAAISGAETSKLSLDKVPLTADGLIFGVVVGMVVSDTTITTNSTYAKLNVSEKELANYKLTYSGSDRGTISAKTDEGEIINSGDSVAEYKTIVIDAVPEDGYTVTYWTVNGKKETGAGNTYTINGLTQDTTVQATFDKGKCTITYDVIGDGTLTAATSGIPLESGESFDAGTKVTLTATPGTNSYLAFWEYKDTQTGEYKPVLDKDGLLLTKLTGDVTLNQSLEMRVGFIENGDSTVTFQTKNDVASMNGHQLKVQSNSGTYTMNPGDSQDGVQNGGTITFTAVPEEGATVNRWTFTPSDPRLLTYKFGALDSVTLQNLNGDYTVTVEFDSIREYTVDFSSQNGTVTAVVGDTQLESGDYVRYKSDVVFTATPSEENYVLTGWNLNGTEVSTDSEYISNITKNARVEAVFGEQTLKWKLSDYSYDANAQMTRFAFAALLASFSGQDISDEQAEQWAADNNILPESHGEFVSREEMAYALYSLAQMNGVDFVIDPEVNMPSDLDEVSGYATEAVMSLIGAGVLLGHSDGTFRPQSSLTEGEAYYAITSLIDYANNASIVEIEEPTVEVEATDGLILPAPQEEEIPFAAPEYEDTEEDTTPITPTTPDTSRDTDTSDDMGTTGDNDSASDSDTGAGADTTSDSGTAESSDNISDSGTTESSDTTSDSGTTESSNVSSSSENTGSDASPTPISSGSESVVME